MVMLDRVGIPSGVQVKKPPMIFIVHPRRGAEEERGARRFSVWRVPVSPPLRRSMNITSNSWSASGWTEGIKPCLRYPGEREEGVLLLSGVEMMCFASGFLQARGVWTEDSELRFLLLKVLSFSWKMVLRLGCGYRVEDSPGHRSCQHLHPCWGSASAVGPRGPEPLPGLDACGSRP